MAPRRTQVQLAEARERRFDAIKNGAIEGYYKLTRCSKCMMHGDNTIKPCVARTAHHFACREHVDA